MGTCADMCHIAKNDKDENFHLNCHRIRESGPSHEGHSGGLVQILLVQYFRTIDEFVKRCHEIENLRRHFTRTRFQRQPNVSAVLAETDVGDIRSIIREIVRDEFEKFLPEMQYYTNGEPE
ncbi:hypothetical protein AVEN_66708-1 [Araneus ventricosus]|uniref:Uncharacterized protein n=1 Tax=Araneus ventricosus TaxID=182803 RepID=A0A4Y2UXK0_ARAVE|nr:hypothetical protein AVEN_66708-1 [Araneus ventricosus]